MNFIHNIKSCHSEAENITDDSFDIQRFNRHELSIIQLCSFIRSYIPSFVHIIYPILTVRFRNHVVVFRWEFQPVVYMYIHCIYIYIFVYKGALHLYELKLYIL